MTLWTWLLPANLICKYFILIFQSISFPWKQRTRQTLNEKISQLNSAIDNVSSRLRGNSKMPKVPVENDPEVEATIWDLFPFDSLWSLGVKGTWIIDFQSLRTTYMLWIRYICGLEPFVLWMEVVWRLLISKCSFDIKAYMKTPIFVFAFGLEFRGCWWNY